MLNPIVLAAEYSQSIRVPIIDRVAAFACGGTTRNKTDLSALIIVARQLWSNSHYNGSSSSKASIEATQSGIKNRQHSNEGKLENSKVLLGLMLHKFIQVSLLQHKR